MLVPRDYQEEGIGEIQSSFLEGFDHPLYVLPTGGGKTVVFCEISNRTVRKGNRVLILVHRIELLRQTSAALSKSGVPHGLINSNYTPDLMAPVQVASVQTLIKRLSKVMAPDIIIVDEAHHTTAGSWRKVINHFNRARVLGVTATPIRTDGKGLGLDHGGIFDKLIIGPQIPDLINNAYLVKPKVYAPKDRLDLSTVNIVGNDYDRKQVVEIVNKPKITGDAVEHYTNICPGVPAVAFCVNVKHAEDVAEQFRLAGYRSYSVDGSMDDDQRTRILNGLGNGQVDVVTSCDLISEGTDIPSIGCAIMLRPTRSLSLYIQQGGRALRPIYAPGFDLTSLDGRLKAIAAGPKPNGAVILDHVGNIMIHGFLDDVREWSLDGKKKKKRRKKDQPDEDEVKVQQCESCFACFDPAPFCPYCGEAKPVQKYAEPKQVDGMLAEVTEEQKRQISKSRRMEIGRARTLEELKQIEKDSGYEHGWAEKLFKVRNDKLIGAKKEKEEVKNLPVFGSDSERWLEALDALRMGTLTVKKLKETRQISPEDEAKLLKAEEESYI